MTTGLSHCFRYNLWANLRLLATCTQLSDVQLDATMEGTFGSVRDTLLHLLISEEGYAHRLTGTAPSPRLSEFTTFPGFEELRKRAEGSGTKLIEFAEHEDQDLEEILHLDEGTYDAPVYIVVIQAIDHGIDHRSQISTILTQQDITPPDLDSWAYNDSLR